MLKCFRKIRNKLICAVLCILLATLGVVTVVTHRKALSVIREQSGILNSSLAEMGAEQIGATASQMDTIYQSIYLDSGFRAYLKHCALANTYESPIGYTDQLKTVLLSRLSSRTDIYSIIFIDMDGRLTYCTRDEAGHYADYRNCGLPESYSALYTQLSSWQRGLKTLATADHMPLRTKSSGEAPEVYAVARKIVNTESHFEPVGVMFITMDLSGCARMANAISTDEATIVYVSDQSGGIIFDSSGILTGKTLPDELNRYFSEESTSASITIDRQAFVIAFSEVPAFSWKVITLVPEDVYAGEASSVSDVILITAIVVLILAAGLTALFSRLMSQPLEQMAETMNRVDSNHLDLRISVRGQDEVAQMGGSFNALMDRLQASIENEYLLDIRQKEATLRALQAQLNPHFLYNVLQSISSMAEVHDTPEIGTIARSLGNLLRYTIQGDSLWASVREEVGHVENYLAIQIIRFGERLHYQINVPEYVMDYRLPRVFLQPMVENAIIHGLEKRQEPLNLLINIYIDGELLHIDVSDDGCGIAPEELARLRARLEHAGIPSKEKGIGLANLKARLMLFYGGRADLKIETEVGIGTSIILSLPAGGE